MIQLNETDSPRSLLVIRDVPPFDSFARPWCFPKERETGFHAGVMEKTADRNATPHLGPAIPLNQFFDDGFQSNSVQRIVGMGKTHDRTANGMELTAEPRRRISYSTEHERGATSLKRMAGAKIARDAGSAYLFTHTISIPFAL